MSKAISWMQGEWGQHRPLGVFCNRGTSRSPTICLMFLRSIGYFPEGCPLSDAVLWLNDRMQGEYKPGPGMKAYVEQWWEREGQ